MLAMQVSHSRNLMSVSLVDNRYQKTKDGECNISTVERHL
jgi:hypothetical protein